MESVRATIFTFAIILLLLGASYFVVIRAVGRPRLAALTQEPALVIRHTTERLPLDPDAAPWMRLEAIKIHLYPQAARAPFGTVERDIAVTGAYTDDEVAFRIEFADATESRDSIFPDECAIMLVPDTAAPVAQMMGHGAGANLWQWRADWDAAHLRPGGDSVHAVRELLASGPGTQNVMPTQAVAGEGSYHDGKWSVVFERQITSRQEGELALGPEGGLAIAFAVWDGARQESLSRKSISILRPLRLDRTARP